MPTEGDEILNQNEVSTDSIPSNVNINFESTNQELEKPEGDEGNNDGNPDGKKKTLINGKRLSEKLGIEAHGVVKYGTRYAGDYATVLSNSKGTLTALIDLNHKKTGFGFQAARLTDFHDDPNNPASKVTILNPYWQKRFGENNEYSLTVNTKYANFDNMPAGNGFNPDVIFDWNINKGTTLEAAYLHAFNKNGPDTNAIRLGVSQAINEVKLVLNSRVQEVGGNLSAFTEMGGFVNLGNGLGVELKFVYNKEKGEDGKGIWQPVVAAVYSR